MTCIAGIEHKGKVWIGADSGGFVDGTCMLHENGKIFRHGAIYLMGVSGSRRVAELLRFAFKPPRLPGKVNADAFMATRFVDEMRQTLRVGGVLERTNDVESFVGAVLVGVRGHGLYYVADNFSASRLLDGTAATGSGMEYALGALEATRELEPKERLSRALLAAERWNDSVRSPFHIESI